jgi:hypothetical protein
VYKSGEGKGPREGGEMTQTLYAHMNKINIFKNGKCFRR